MSRSKSLAGRLIALFISALMIVGIMTVTSMADSPKILELGGEYEEGNEILFEAMTYVVFFQERHGGTYDIYRLATSEEKVLKVDSIEYSEDDDGYIMVIEGLNNYFTIPSDYLGKDVKAKILRGDGTQSNPFIFPVIPAEGQTASAPLTLGVVYHIGEFVPFEMGEVISISDDHFTTSVVEQFLTWVKPIYGEVQDIKYSEQDKQYEVVFGTGGMFHEFFDLDSDYIGDEVSIRLTGGDGTAEDPYTFEIVSSDGDYTGWQKVDGQWYYFEKSGAMKTGWHEENGKTYYFKADGVMATDWCQIDNIWYHFGENGVKQ